ncbi:hypothetical protein LX36DRAFT_329207 [Colletotrichum falcatum]|nr:hypothetical protein LX36DRAFT_329207 [Colletotrichum falcatum]
MRRSQNRLRALYASRGQYLLIHFTRPSAWIVFVKAPPIDTRTPAARARGLVLKVSILTGNGGEFGGGGKHRQRNRALWVLPRVVTRSVGPRIGAGLGCFEGNYGRKHAPTTNTRRTTRIGGGDGQNPKGLGIDSGVSRRRLHRAVTMPQSPARNTREKPTNG